MFALGVSFLYGVAIAASYRGRVHGRRRADAAARAARLLRDAGASPPRARARSRRADCARPTSRLAGRRWAACDPEAPGAVRRRRRRRDGHHRDPVLLDAARLRRRGHRPGRQHDAQGLRPARQGLRARLQRAAAARRAGRQPARAGRAFTNVVDGGRQRPPASSARRGRSFIPSRAPGRPAGRRRRRTSIPRARRRTPRP